MPFLRPSFSALREQAKQDITSGIAGIGGLLPISLIGTLAYVQAGFSHLHYEYLDWIAKQSVPYTATGEHMEAWSNLKGIIRKSATSATGTVTFTGTSGTIPQGSQLVRADGVTYLTTAEGTLSLGTATVPVQAVLEGETGNAGPGITLTLSTLVPGVASAATTATALVGGADTEDDASLRSRMLIRYAQPPQGGNEHDYVDWCLAVPGVTRAWCRPNGAGAGTVVIYACKDDSAHANGFLTGTTGVAAQETRATPATGDQLAIANYLYPVEFR